MSTRRSSACMQAISQMSLDRFRIRRAVPADHDALVDIWIRAVRATDKFQMRESVLSNLELWVLCSRWSEPCGFMGLSGASVEALFIAPEWIGLGGGSRLLNHARALKGRLRVEVDEQNPGATRFYRACGFEVVDRRDVDSGARPYPVLRMRQAV
jgi:putative acetyltransferase